HIRAFDAGVVGDELPDRTPSGLWPSDHGGVVATLGVHVRPRDEPRTGLLNPRDVLQPADRDRVSAFFRLFGDSDGDRDVDWQDRDLFRSAFEKIAGEADCLWFFDFDGDGDV